MSEKRIRISFNADYRRDKNLKPCSDKTARSLEIYKDQQYCARLLKIIDKSPMKKKNICDALDITIAQYSQFRRGIGIYPSHKKIRLEEFVAGFIDHNLNKD